MENLTTRAKNLLERYANLDGYEDMEENEMLLEEAMNIISEFVSK